MREVIVGFTGTRQGMSDLQKQGIRDAITSRQEAYGEPVIVVGLHGDCIGADAEFNAICREMGAKTQCRPCNLRDQRAYTNAEVIAEPEQPLDRNKKIVDDCTLMVAAPAENFSEFEFDMEKTPRRGGTWSTIRYAARGPKNIVILQRSTE